MGLSEILVLDYDFVPDTTHLLQLVQPAECVAAMLPFVEGQIEGGATVRPPSK